MSNAVVDNIGKEIGGRYRILARIGEGGMGTVYRAEQISLKRKVAVKVLKSELSADPSLVRRFNAEAELAAKLNHPNTVTLYDFGQDDDGSLFIAMEFVEGESLRDVMLREGPIPVPRAIHICDQVCARLQTLMATASFTATSSPTTSCSPFAARKVTSFAFSILESRSFATQRATSPRCP